MSDTPATSAPVIPGCRVQPYDTDPDHFFVWMGSEIIAIIGRRDGQWFPAANSTYVVSGPDTAALMDVTLNPKWRGESARRISAALRVMVGL